MISYISQIQQPGWFLRKEAYANKNIMTAYKTFIKTLVTNLQASPILNPPPIPFTDEDLNNMLELEKSLVSVCVEDKRNHINS